MHVRFILNLLKDAKKHNHAINARHAVECTFRLYTYILIQQFRNENEGKHPDDRDFCDNCHALLVRPNDGNFIRILRYFTKYKNIKNPSLSNSLLSLNEEFSTSSGKQTIFKMLDWFVEHRNSTFGHGTWNHQNSVIETPDYIKQCRIILAKWQPLRNISLSHEDQQAYFSLNSQNSSDRIPLSPFVVVRNECYYFINGCNTSPKYQCFYAEKNCSFEGENTDTNQYLNPLLISLKNTHFLKFSRSTNQIQYSSREVYRICDNNINAITTIGDVIQNMKDLDHSIKCYLEDKSRCHTDFLSIFKNIFEDTNDRSKSEYVLNILKKIITRRNFPLQTLHEMQKCKGLEVDMRNIITEKIADQTENLTEKAQKYLEIAKNKISLARYQEAYQFTKIAVDIYRKVYINDKNCAKQFFIALVHLGNRTTQNIELKDLGKELVLESIQILEEALSIATDAPEIISIHSALYTCYSKLAANYNHLFESTQDKKQRKILQNKAFDYLIKAADSYKLIDKEYINNKKLKLYCIQQIELGAIYKDNKKYIESIHHFEIAREISQNLGEPEDTKILSELLTEIRQEIQTSKQ